MTYDDSDELPPSKPQEVAARLASGEISGIDLLQLSVIGVELDDPDFEAKLDTVRKMRLSRGRPEIEPLQQPERPAPVHLVYYMRLRDTIKIGYTSRDPAQRRLELRADEVLAVEPGTRTLERERHDQFHKHRISHLGGERFRDVPELRKHIARIRSEFPELTARHAVTTRKLA